MIVKNPYTPALSHLIPPRSLIRRMGIVLVYSLIVLGLTIPQPMMAQVGDGTGGPPAPTPNSNPGDGTGGPAVPSTTPHPGDGTGGPVIEPADPSDSDDPGDEVGDDHDHDLPDTPSGSGGGSSRTGATEPPIKLEVVDCPGVVREINAFNIPPSIYPKPNCGPGTSGGQLGQPTGKYGTDLGAPPEGALFWVITGNETYDIGQGFGMTDWAANSDYGQDAYKYCTDMGVPGHCAVDVSTPAGTPLYSPVDGTVTVAGGTGYYCDTIAGGAGCGPGVGQLSIEMANGDVVILGHMRRIDVNVGDKVTAGQYVGISGGENGAHLHLEYREKTGDGYTARDPREMFELPAGSVKPHGGPVLGAKTERGKVLQATTTAPDFPTLQEKYGLDPVSGPSGVDFEANKENIVKLRDYAIKVAPEFDIDPEIIVMWTLTETYPPYDSYSYSHCHNMGGIIDPGQTCIDNNWQVGYGQQYSVFGGISKAWEFFYGADNPTKVQQVLQNSATQAGLSVTAPSTTAAALSSESDRFWTMVMSRDQPISAYLLGQELASDLQNAKNAGYGNRLWDFACENGWGDAYCAGSEYRQRFSNTLNDILLNWGMVGTGSSDQVCKVGVSATNSNCSTMPDVLGGMSVEEFTAKINENMAAYKRIADCADVPWEMMAAIHLRETALDANYTGPGSNGALGPWQIDPTGALWGSVDPYDFEEAGCAVAKGELQAKAQSGPLGRPLRKDMDPSKKDDEYSIKDAFFAYNGRAGFEQNIPLGCTPDLDGNPDLDFDCSAYVMNNMDANHTGMCIGTGGGNCFDDPNDGTWKTYFKLHYSTFGEDGKLLVYGGNCNLNNEVINGYAAPTKAGLNINRQFFKPPHYHKGIDIANLAGEPIFALSDGDIIISGWDPEGGYYLILHIEPRGGQPEMWVYYGHLEPNSFPNTDNGPVPVKAGQEIGRTGELEVVRPDGTRGPNGNTLGAHLHFDIRHTAAAPATQEDHIDPCTLDIMRNSYPTLECGNTPPSPVTP